MMMMMIIIIIIIVIITRTITVSSTALQQFQIQYNQIYFVANRYKHTVFIGF